MSSITNIPYNIRSMNGQIVLNDGAGTLIQNGAITTNTLTSTGQVSANSFSGNLYTQNIQPVTNSGTLSLYTNSTGSSTWGNIAGTLQFNPALTFMTSLNGISTTVFGYLSGLTGNIQTQINSISTSLSSTYLTIANASTTYLTISNATSTYQTITGMSSYLSSALASSTYLSISNASSTYQTITGMSSYLTSALASSTYLTIANATSTYQTITGMSSYVVANSPVINDQLTLPTTTANPTILQLGGVWMFSGTWTTVNNYVSGSTTVTNLMFWQITYGTWHIVVNINIPNDSVGIYVHWNKTNTTTFSDSNVICSAKTAGDSNTAGSSRNSCQLTYVLRCNGSACNFINTTGTINSNVSMSVVVDLFLQVMTNYAGYTGAYNVIFTRIA